MYISPHKRNRVYLKTNHRCSICGSEKDLVCTCFIPEWTRIVDTSTDNMIPLCSKCFADTRYKLIEIGSLRYLPDIFVQQLMRYYKHIANYLYKYVRMYGSYRTNNKLNIEQSCLILNSYDEYIKEHKDELDWENL